MKGFAERDRYRLRLDSDGNDLGMIWSCFRDDLEFLWSSFGSGLDSTLGF